MAFESESNNSVTSMDHYNIYDLDSEPENEYCEGGFMKLPDNVVIAERYEIIQKLGWGHGGIVYLCKDNTSNTFKALKIFKSHQFYKQEFRDEVKILEKILESSDGKFVVKLFEHFKIKGKYGKHVCAIYELLGVSVYEILKFYKFKGFPIQLCRFIAKEILTALVFFHETCGIFVGDLRAKNILLKLTNTQMEKLENEGMLREKLDFAVFKHTETPISVLNKALGCGFSLETSKKPKGPKPKKGKKSGNSKETLKKINKLGLIHEEFLIKFTNLGSACELSENCIREIQTINYRSPEILLRMNYSFKIDIWSFGCLLFELVTGYNLFEPIKGKKYRKEDDLLAQMIEFLGDFDKEFVLKSEVGRNYFDEGKLKKIRMLRRWPIKYLLIH